MLKAERHWPAGVFARRCEGTLEDHQLPRKLLWARARDILAAFAVDIACVGDSFCGSSGTGLLAKGAIRRFGAVVVAIGRPEITLKRREHTRHQ